MSNRLAAEKSPYLLQHKDNPVDWYPWGPEAFARAKAEDKPILLSIGYSTCHWCHVMEHESFSVPATAAVMNEHFVCVKLDREERPDVDKLYMTAVQALSGQGGWPLNVFLTPDLKPFYGELTSRPTCASGGRAGRCCCRTWPGCGRTGAPTSTRTPRAWPRPSPPTPRPSTTPAASPLGRRSTSRCAPCAPRSTPSRAASASLRSSRCRRTSASSCAATRAPARRTRSRWPSRPCAR
ncbi:MAG: thioredoxin domain-containing protein [Elusimicrobiota bacterium]|nr:MAG: thioredoxin domain-containing protein [Elusimicrobiota bacterium]